MSRYLSIASVFFFLVIASCQKEQSFEQGKVSKGSLQGTFGDCLNKTVAGIYTATKALADSNYIDVDVDVTEAGRYTIYTDTVNGYYFRGTGNFTTIGSATVRMKGFGTPGTAGTDDFIVFFDSSFCNVSVTVISNSGSSGGTAVYSLAASGGNCMNATPAGTFTQGIALTSANKVSIDVNVTTVGTWNITTSSTAGISFTGSGTFASTGVQTITLNGVGTPSASGSQSFNVTAGSSSCSFTIPIAAGTIPPNPPPNTGDYFPRTVGSHWTYMFDGDPDDTLRRYVISQTKTVGSNVYNIFMEDDGFSIDTSGYYRKSGGDYFQFGDVAGDFGLDNPLYSEIVFFKDNQAAGYSWTTSTYSGTLGGTPISVRDKFTITQKNITATSNGFQYPNTIVVKFENQYAAGPSWISSPEYLLVYFTKNYGITKIEIYDGTTNTLSDKLELIDYKVF